MQNCEVGNVAVSEDHLLDALAANQLLQLVFGVNGDALRVSASTQRGWIPPAGDARDLGSREGDDLVAGVLTEVGIEGVEVPAGCSHDEYALDRHAAFSFHCRDAGADTARAMPTSAPPRVQSSRLHFLR